MEGIDKPGANSVLTPTPSSLTDTRSTISAARAANTVKSEIRDAISVTVMWLKHEKMSAMSVAPTAYPIGNFRQAKVEGMLNNSPMG